MKVLVVECNLAIGGILVAQCRRLGFVANPVRNGVQAHLICPLYQPDIIICNAAVKDFVPEALGEIRCGAGLDFHPRVIWTSFSRESEDRFGSSAPGEMLWHPIHDDVLAEALSRHKQDILE